MGFGASEAARFQAYQTRAAMGVQLWARALMLAAIVWVGLTTYVVWRATGAAFPQLGHEYFWRWAICGVLTHTPVIDAIAPLPGSGPAAHGTRPPKTRRGAAPLCSTLRRIRL